MRHKSGIVWNYIISNNLLTEQIIYDKFYYFNVLAIKYTVFTQLFENIDNKNDPWFASVCNMRSTFFCSKTFCFLDFLNNNTVQTIIPLVSSYVFCQTRKNLKLITGFNIYLFSVYGFFFL